MSTITLFLLVIKNIQHAHVREVNARKDGRDSCVLVRQQGKANLEIPHPSSTSPPAHAIVDTL